MKRLSQYYETTYHVLDHLRERPVLFLGNWYLRNPFTALMTFLSGLQFSEIDPGHPSLWEFSRWITAHASLSTCLVWDEFEEQRGKSRHSWIISATWMSIGSAVR